MALVVDNMKKAFDTPAGCVEVLKGVSLRVARGEWVCVMGQSGSGKSTLLRGASGLIGIDAGHATIDGTSISCANNDELARLRRSSLGFVFQDYNLIDSLTARENVALPLLLEGSSEDIDTRVMRALESTDMAAIAGRDASALSGGEQQRVAIARALAQHPTILFADEPTGALDSVTSRIVLDLFRTLTDEGSAVLMVTHDLDAATRGDRVLILADGLVVHEVTRPSAAQLFEMMNEVAR